MGYSPQEFDAAFAKVSGKYTFASRSIAEQVLGHLETFIRQNDRVTLATKKTFRQLIQDSLIEANVKGEINQKPYKSIIGHIYGRHGNYVASRYKGDAKKRPPQPRFPTTEPATTVTERPNGQLMWKF